MSRACHKFPFSPAATHTLIDIDKATRIINGGTNGLNHRKELYASAQRCIPRNDNPPPTAAQNYCVPLTGSGFCSSYGVRLHLSLFLSIFVRACYNH